MTQEPMLKVAAASKSFGAVKAVEGVSFTIMPDTITSVIGPNGAGKTTLFNAISGFSPLDSGLISFEGEDVTHDAPHSIARRGLVRTFQAARPLRDSTVLENVVAGTYLHGRGGALASLFPLPAVRRAERRRAGLAEESLERVGLLGEHARFPHELSAGQLRLLEIARALAASPKLVLLDEPAAGLNRAETARLESALLQVRKSGVTVVLVEHDVDLVMRVSDLVLVLDFGRLLAQGAPSMIRNDASVAEAYFGFGEPPPAVSTAEGAAEA